MNTSLLKVQKVAEAHERAFLLLVDFLEKTREDEELREIANYHHRKMMEAEEVVARGGFVGNEKTPFIEWNFWCPVCKEIESGLVCGVCKAETKLMLAEDEEDGYNGFVSSTYLESRS